MPASRPPNIVEQIWLAYAFDDAVELDRVRAGLDRVGEHYQEVMADPLRRDAALGDRLGLALWQRGDERLRWPLWAQRGGLSVAWTSAPTGWSRVIGDLDPAAAPVELALALRDDPDRLVDVGPPFLVGMFESERQELVVVNDSVGTARLYELRTPAGRVWSNRLGALPLFAGIAPEADLRGWQTLAAAGWFLGETTALRGARKLPAASILTARPAPGEAAVAHWTIPAHERLAGPRDVDPEAAAAEAAEGAMACAGDVRQLWSAPITVDLSGGRDTRVSAAAAIAAGLDAEFQTVDADPGEVDTVRKLIKASKRPIDHVVLEPEPPSVDEDLFERLRLLHHFHDGMVNPQAGGRGAIEPRHVGYEGPVISGHGGEIGHGFYYRAPEHLKKLRGKGLPRMVKRLMNMARKGGAAAQREAYAAYREEVIAILERGKALGLSGPNLLDYFYFAERLAHRSGLGVRNDRYSPCSTPGFIRACFDLRPAERLDLKVHRAVVGRLVPEWSGIPFFAGAGTTGDVNYDRPWERERDAARLEEIILADESWHGLFEPGRARWLWGDAKAGRGTAHHERLFLRIAWRASFEDHIRLLSRRAAGVQPIA